MNLNQFIKTKNLTRPSFLFAFIILWSCRIYGQIIIDHTCTNINSIPESAIEAAKDSLHIAYDHTSHGSQLITGMNSLDAFMGGNGLYVWSEGGGFNVLDIDDDFSPTGDLGYENNLGPGHKNISEQSGQCGCKYNHVVLV